MGGGVPTSGALIHAEAGFPGLPTVAYHHSLRRGFSVGGVIGLDYGHYRPSKGFFEALLVAAVARWTLHRDTEWSVGLKAQPGLVLGFYDGANVGIAATVAGQATYTLEHRLIVGGGVEVPLLLDIPTRRGRSTRFVVPILVGPVAEFHVTPPLGITVDAKTGVHLSTDDGARFGLKLMLGAVYRI